LNIPDPILLIKAFTLKRGGQHLNKLRSVQKIGAILGGIYCLYLGHDLLLKGVTGEFDFSFGFQGAKGRLASVSPGLFFVLIGAIIIIFVVRAKETYKTSDETETFSDGMRKSTRHVEGGGCFVSTAICYGLDQPDNCMELKILRSFRDSYLLQSKVGQFFVRRYYDLSPKISETIENSTDSNEICLLLKEQYLHPCISNIESGNNIKAIVLYIKMFLDLHKSFSETSKKELTLKSVRATSRNGLLSTILYGLKNCILFFHA
jgi:hypothetical protein